MKVLIIVGVAVVIVGSFMAGTFASGGNWKVDARIQGNQRISQAGTAKQQELLENSSDIIIEEVIDPLIEIKIAELEAQLEAYFYEQLHTIGDSVAYAEIEDNFQTYLENSFTSQKSEIDKLFN